MLFRSQGASRVAPEKSSLHLSCDGERGIALESQHKLEEEPSLVALRLEANESPWKVKAMGSQAHKPETQFRRPHWTTGCYPAQGKTLGAGRGCSFLRSLTPLAGPRQGTLLPHVYGPGHLPTQHWDQLPPESSVPAWSIPWTEEPGKLQSIGLQRVRQD